MNVLLLHANDTSLTPLPQCAEEGPPEVWCVGDSCHLRNERGEEVPPRDDSPDEMHVFGGGAVGLADGNYETLFTSGAVRRFRIERKRFVNYRPEVWPTRFERILRREEAGQAINGSLNHRASDGGPGPCE